MATSVNVNPSLLMFSSGEVGRLGGYLSWSPLCTSVWGVVCRAGIGAEDGLGDGRGDGIMADGGGVLFSIGGMHVGKC